MFNIMGIYKIENVLNKKFYIGSSVDIPKRWKQHRSQLNNSKHHNHHLQRAWAKYGEQNFKFEIIEIVQEVDMLLSAEQKWLNKTKSYNGEIGYNISMDASRPSTKNPYESTHYNANFVFREMAHEIVDMKLEVNEKLVYYVLRDFTTFPSNSVVINGKIPTFPQLENIVGLKERTIRKAIKTLEEKGLFKLKQSGHKKAIYVNPAYYSTGKGLNIEILRMFDLANEEEKISLPLLDSQLIDKSKAKNFLNLSEDKQNEILNKLHKITQIS